MSRPRFFRALGALVASAALVLSGSLTAHAAGDSFSVTVKVLDKDTGELIDGKVRYWSEVLQKDVVFNNGAKITINANNLPNDWDTGSSSIHFQFEGEAALKYGAVEEYGWDDWPCRAYYDDNGGEILCVSEKKLSTTLNVVDETGKTLTLDAAFTGFSSEFYGLSSDGKTYYYWEPDESLTLYKPGYVTTEVSGLVNGGVTTVVLKKASMREVRFNFVDARTGEPFTDMAGLVWLDGRDEKYSIFHGKLVKIPDYGAGFMLEGDSGVIETYADGYEWKVGGGRWFFEKLSDINRAEVPAVHVRVVDENGNRVPDAIVRFTDDYSWGYGTPQVKTKVSNGKSDVVYVPVFLHSALCAGDCSSDYSAVSIDVQVPEGYENPEPVKAFPHQVPRNEFKFWGFDAPDSRVQFFDTDATNGWCVDRDYETGECLLVSNKYSLGEVVTITLKKKPVSSPSSSATPSPTALPSLSPKPSVSPSVKPSATSSPKPSVSPQPGGSCDVSGGFQEVYRLYNPVTSEHLFTTDKKEYEALAAKHGWKQEGVAWVSPDATASSVGVYRLYNPGLGDHHYTKDQNEAAALVNKFGWVYDNDAKPLFYSDDSCQRVSVYRQYNPALRIGQHHYTADENEAKALITKHGWKNEAIGWYAIKRR